MKRKMSPRPSAGETWKEKMSLGIGVEKWRIARTRERTRRALCFACEMSNHADVDIGVVGGLTVFSTGLKRVRTRRQGLKTGVAS